MNYGMIIKVGITRSIVMNEAMEMVSIKKKPGMAEGMRIYYLEEDLMKGKLRQAKVWMPYAAIATMLILMALTLQYIQRPTPLVPETFAVITMDINPSVELDVNSGGKVISIRAINNDAASLIIGNFETMTLEEALERLLVRAKEQGYLRDNGAVLLASTQGKINAENTFDVSEVVTDFIMSHKSDYTFMYYEGDEKELALAREQSLSLGRYKMNHLIDDQVFDDAVLSQMPISEFANNREIIELLQQAQNQGELKMFRAGALLYDEAPLGESPQTRAEPSSQEAYKNQSENQISNQEKDGGGGANTDNGQQQSGNTDTNEQGENQEKDGGGGANTDNGQQQSGNTDTNEQGENQEKDGGGGANTDNGQQQSGNTDTDEQGENQENDGGGGENSDNGQQQSGNTDTDEQGENQENDGGGGQNSDNGQQQIGDSNETPKETTDAALEVKIIVETSESDEDDDEDEAKDQAPKGENSKEDTSDKGVKSGK